MRMLSLVRYPYLIFYRTKGDEIEILHIRRGARQRPEFDQSRLTADSLRDSLRSCESGVAYLGFLALR